MRTRIIGNTIFTILTSLALTLIFAPAFYAGAQTAPNLTAAKTIELKYAGWFPQGQMLERMPAYWAEEVAKRTQGRVKVTNYYGQSLGKFSDFPDMILGGTCDLAYVSPMSKGFDLLGANDLPFVISNTAISMDVANGLYRSGLFSSMFEKNGFKPLYFQPTDPFSFFFRKKKITTLDELTPMKLRGVTPPQIALIKALGASGVAIPTTDLYMALDRGTVDGLISSPEYCLSAKLFEVLEYCIWEPVGTPVGAVVINFKTWKSLPPDVQVIIEELNQEVRYKFMDLQKSSQKYREELTQRGIAVYDLTPKESKLWHAKGETLIKDWVEDKKAKGQPGQEIVNFIYKTISQYDK